MWVDWFDHLITLGALQGFILAMVIWKKKNANRVAITLLSSLVFLTSLILVGRFFYLSEFLNHFWVVYIYVDVVIFLFGPMIYFFTQTLLGKDLPPWSKIRWHFIPALVHLLVFNTIISLTKMETISFLSRSHFILLYYTLEFLAIVSMSIYSWKSIQFFNQSKREYYGRFSFPDVSSFLKPFLYFFSFISIIWGLTFVLKFFFTLPGDSGSVYYGFWTLVSFSTYLLSYKILSNPNALNAPKLDVVEKTKENQQTKIENNDEYLAAKNQLAQFLITSKIYHNPKLSLEDLAQATDISRHELSKIINQGFGKNFFDLINSYRIKEFIKTYEEDEKLTFLEVAYQVGFNSKSAFNRAFRKEKGTNPSEFFKKRLPFQKA